MVQSPQIHLDILELVMVRFGLVGYGAWGGLHAQAIRDTPGAQLTAVCARSRDSLERAMVENGCRVTDDFRELAALPEVDAVDVVLPSCHHARVAIKALEHGKHVLLEKPMAVSPEQCRRIARAATEANRVLYIGHEMRLSPLWSAVKELIESGQLGTPRYAHLETWRRPFRQGADGWRFEPKSVGSWLLEEPIHLFDLARWYFQDVGEPETIIAYGNGTHAREGMYQNFNCTIGFPQHAFVVVSHTTAAFHYRQSVRVTGTEGAVSAEWEGAADRDMGPRICLHWFNGGEIHAPPMIAPTGEVYELQKEVARMVACVEGDAVPAASGTDGAAAVDICAAARTSIEEGRSVSLTGSTTPRVEPSAGGDE